MNTNDRRNSSVTPRQSKSWLNLIWSSVSINQHQLASISINQHQKQQSEPISINQFELAYVSINQHKLAFIIINQHQSQFNSSTTKNYVYWHKCSKSQKLPAGSILAHHDLKSSCRSYQEEIIWKFQQPHNRQKVINHFFLLHLFDLMSGVIPLISR